MADLTEKEQEHVRAALRYQRRQFGGWAPIAKALRYRHESIEQVVRGLHPVTPQMTFRLARLIGVSIDALLDGTYVPGACPKCGHVPSAYEGI